MTPETLAQLARLLASPDEPGLAARGSRIRFPGRSDRRQAYLRLLVRWAVRRWTEADQELGVVSPGRHASAQTPVVERKRLEFRKR
jgi:hypothetical protein